ncbi:MAG: AAA family ATPase [Planctomycetes bacterium]|nr:AAA family ATPase [Planctomycetota bacterium]
MRVLNNAVDARFLTTVSAPAGYGKTTLAQKLRGSNGRRRFYFAVPAGIGDRTQWWDSLVASLAKQGLETAPALRRMGFPHNESITMRVIDHLRTLSPPIMLILDDYQNFTDDVLNTFWENLVRAAPGEDRVVIFSRVKPGLDQDSLEQAKLATAYDQELLKFSKDEAVAFFFLNGVPDRATALRAWRYSEGWATALWLYLRNGTAAEKPMPTADVSVLLDEAVFATCSAEDRQLLLQMSVIDSFAENEEDLERILEVCLLQNGKNLHAWNFTELMAMFDASSWRGDLRWRRSRRLTNYGRQWNRPRRSNVRKASTSPSAISTRRWDVSTGFPNGSGKDGWRRCRTAPACAGRSLWSFMGKA